MSEPGGGDDMAPPMSEASTTFPLRMRYMYTPTSKAMGIVQKMVKVPQELPANLHHNSIRPRNRLAAQRLDHDQSQARKRIHDDE